MIELEKRIIKEEIENLYKTVNLCLDLARTDSMQAWDSFKDGNKEKIQAGYYYDGKTVAYEHVKDCINNFKFYIDYILKEEENE